jgi:hypothetical protein
MEAHQRWRSATRFSHPLLEIVVVSLDLYGLVSNSCNCLVINIKDVSTSKNDLGAGDDTRGYFWDIVSRKFGPDIALAWWRRTAVNGVADGGGCGGEGVLAPTEYEWGNGAREEGGTMSLGRACLKCRESYKLSPRLKFQTSERYWSVGDRTVISHLPNSCRERFRPRRGCFGTNGV